MASFGLRFASFGRVRVQKFFLPKPSQTFPPPAKKKTTNFIVRKKKGVNLCTIYLPGKFHGSPARSANLTIED